MSLSIVLWTLLLLSGCGGPPVEEDRRELAERGALVLLTRNNAVCYADGPRGPVGFEYELAKAFADDLGVPLVVRTAADEAGMIAALLAGQGDFIAPGFPFGEEARQALFLGPGYMTVHPQVVGRRGGPVVKSEASLSGRTLWTTPVGYRVEALAAFGRQHDGIRWKTVAGFDAEDLLRMVSHRSLMLAVVDSNMVLRNHLYYPELKIVWNLGLSRQLTWAMAPADRPLQRAAAEWFARDATRRRIDGLIDHHYGHHRRFDYVDLARYRRRVKARLPTYRPVFESAAARYGIEWTLLAALSYQESHWNPLARSYTGVRGIMMLTQDTAATLGIEDRLDVETSIYAGARYLSYLHRQVPEHIPEPDRTYLALSAYNLGLGHTKDAMVLARRLNRAEDTWASIRSVLPLLQNRQYYRTLQHRYARGGEAVVFVDRIRIYEEVLDWILVESDITESLGEALP